MFVNAKSSVSTMKEFLSHAILAQVQQYADGFCW